MNRDELDALESALSVTLPAYYRSAALDGRLDRLLNSDANSITAINRAFRQGDFGDEAWPHHMFAFGDDGGGNMFCLDLSTPNNNVFRRDHETLELIPEAADFDAWLGSR